MESSTVSQETPGSPIEGREDPMRTITTKKAVNSQKLSHILSKAFALTAIAFALAVGTRAQTETTLHSFANDANGYNPVASLVFDAAGNLYSTTSEGGNFTGCNTGCGVVFELTPGFGGEWSESLAHTFASGRDGATSFTALTPDGAGNFFGVTSQGGTTIKNTLGYGTVFKLSPKSGGGWNETLVHSFTGAVDGANPYGTLILDSAGNLYGTAHNGGNASCNCGVVFKMSPQSGGGWKETLLHTFTAKDGAHPSANLVFDTAGNLYGTTTWGGSGCTSGNCGVGVVFELSPTSGGWKEIVLHQFQDSSDGAYPNGGLIFDTAGNMYSTAEYGGNRSDCSGSGCGTVFKLSPRPGGGWTFSTIHTFVSTDGSSVLAGLLMDASGNLYGAAQAGGSSNCGVVFKLSPASGGGWTDSTLYQFTCGNDGGYPQSTLISDSAGNLYGTTQIGGANGRGAVFEITP
jgi:uncharacterized repeat protein (TIGR03803 family)